MAEGGGGVFDVGFVDVLGGAEVTDAEAEEGGGFVAGAVAFCEVRRCER